MKTILEEAEELVNGDRQKDYGDAKENLQRIADFWSIYLNKQVYANDVCAMMRLLKEARLIHSPDHRDSLVDIAGYVALTEKLK
jgi:hypothetical protein